MHTAPPTVSLSTESVYVRQFEYNLEVSLSARPAKLHSERHMGVEKINKPGERHVDHKQPQSVGEWLRLCRVDLSENEVPWPPNKLNRLPNLRNCPEVTPDQCIAWHIFRDDRAVCLPSFEMLVPTLDAESCSDAWLLEKPIKMKEARLGDFKSQLLENKTPKIRILNVPVKEKMVKRSLQNRHLTMVRNKVQELYGVGKDHPVDVHKATLNMCPQGTATEVHHDSDPHISTACGRSDACLDQPMKLWILWRASDSRLLPTCYSDTVSALEMLGPCGYIMQYSGESLMLPANVPHAALSLSPHVLYGQTFHVEGRARDPTTFGLELSAGAQSTRSLLATRKDFKTQILEYEQSISLKSFTPWQQSVPSCAGHTNISTSTALWTY